MQAALEEGDLKKDYKIKQFKCIYLSKGKEHIEIHNKGAQFNQQLAGLQRIATNGDTFLFTEILEKNAKEDLNSLVIHIE